MPLRQPCDTAWLRYTGATSKSRLELVVSKPHYKKYRENFVGNALRYRRSLHPDTEVAAHAP